MNVTRWEYLTHLVKTIDIGDLDRALAYFGAGGWEVVSMTSTHKLINPAWKGNEIILVMKRPTNEPADLNLRAPQLYDESGLVVKDAWAIPS